MKSKKSIIRSAVNTLQLEAQAILDLIKNINDDFIKIVNLIIESEGRIILTGIGKEACPHNLALTAQLAKGDALTICLLHARNFNEQDFAKFHPGGSLDKKLYLKTGDLALKNQKTIIHPDAAVKDIIIEISRNCLGAVVVVDKNIIPGIITDGDIIRMPEKHSNLTDIKTSDLMNPNPKKTFWQYMPSKSSNRTTSHNY